MKIYTRSGDRGRTSLFSGERVSKDSERIEAYGDVDELNSSLGVLAALISRRADPSDEIAALQADLLQIQEDLFVASGWLATRPGSPAGATLTPFSEERTARLETVIDRYEARLEPLTRFLFPGGDLAAAWCHMARCICRRAERSAVHLRAQERDAEASAGTEAPKAEDPAAGEAALAHERILAYLNRLSDFLFVLARTCNRIAGETDRLWQP